MDKCSAKRCILPKTEYWLLLLEVEPVVHSLMGGGVKLSKRLGSGLKFSREIRIVHSVNGSGFYEAHRTHTRPKMNDYPRIPKLFKRHPPTQLDTRLSCSGFLRVC